MTELIEIKTQDGSYSLRSLVFHENFHSVTGALNETRSKFIAPSNLKRFNGRSLNVLDICFGLGYNSALLINDLIKQKSSLNWYALEIDKKPLEYALKNESFREIWNPKIIDIFDFLYKQNRYEDQFFKCKIIWGEAREKINKIPPNIKFDLIYLDGFSPPKCPQVWTVEFLNKVSQKLKPEGYLITYTSSAAVRTTLRNNGLNIFRIKPNRDSRNSWSQGTVAIPELNKNQLKDNLCIDNLSTMEEDHLLTKASIPYRDPFLNSKKEEILKKRLKEQSLSHLKPTKEWRNQLK